MSPPTQRQKKHEEVVFESDRLILRRRVRLALFAALPVAVAAAALAWPRGSVERLDESVRFAHVADFEELHQVEGSWVGTVSKDWPGVIDNDIARKACEELARSVQLGPQDSVTFIGPSGTPIVDCGPQVP